MQLCVNKTVARDKSRDLRTRCIEFVLQQKGCVDRRTAIKLAKAIN